MGLQLVQRKVLVSGGSRGIGHVIVEHFLVEGAEVASCARSEAGVTEAMDCFDRHAFDMPVDITDPQQVCSWVARSALHLDGVDIIMSDISVLTGGGDLDTWRRAFETDLSGSMDMVVAASPWLKRSEVASMVLISSVSDREADTFAKPYGVFKATLVRYRRTLVSHHAKDDTRVSTVPLDSVYFEGDVWDTIERNSSETFTRRLTANPMGRMARPDGMTRAVLLLASPVASFITGTNLLTDDGLTQDVQF